MKAGMKMRVISFMLCLAMLVSLLPTPVFAAGGIISSANATITKPVGGQNPDMTPVSDDSGKYSVSVYKWYLYEAPYTEVKADDVFETGKKYALRIIFTSQIGLGYEFDNNTQFTVNGENTNSFGQNGLREIIYTAADPAIQPTTYTVSFDANGGSGTMTAVNNISGNYTLPPNSFTPPANKQFKCWSVDGIEKNPFESITVSSNVVVKAMWKDIDTTAYTISFNSNGGSGSMTSVTNAPSLYTLPANGFTPPANKQFKCWAVGPLNDEYDPGDKINITADITIKAVWESITSSKQIVSDVVATSSDIDTIPTLYGLLKIPTFTITQGAPAYINASTSNLRWQKNIGGIWTNQDSGRFTPGEWRIISSLRIDGEDAYHYELGNPTTLTVNGQAWTVENDGKPNVHPDYSHANIVSPVFTIVDDPNVQPPVSVQSVQMILNGYQIGAQISATSVETDAMVDVEILGFLKPIDINGDGQPDSSSVATGIFEENVIYAIGISIRAKNGYDISGLTGQSVSLDRSLLDMIEEPGDDETFTGIYILDNIVQHTVSFETNGGSAISPVKVSKGKTLVLPANPTRAYYAFAGWYEDEALTKTFDSDTPITADTTLYAKWTPSPVGGMFVVTIDLNGGTSTMPTSGEVPAGSTIYFADDLGEYVTPPSGKVLAGYEIDGVPYNPGTGHIVTQNFTLKLIWKDAPAEHICNIKPVPKDEPSCTETGREAHYMCESCGKTFEDELGTVEIPDILIWGVIGELGHDFADATCTEPKTCKRPDCGITEGEANGHTDSDWKSNEEGHWKECTVAGCGVIIENSENNHNDGNNDGVCDVCLYNIGVPNSNPDATIKPENTPGPGNVVKNPETGDNNMLKLYVALLLISGAAIITMAAANKKQRTKASQLLKGYYKE